MKPGRFKYHPPSSKAEALELKARYDVDGSFLAGGQSLMPMMNMRLAQPEALIDLNRVPELSYVEERGDRVVIGALTRHAEAERDALLGAACPLMGEALRHVGHQVIRNRGTIGGSVAHADSAAELPAALAALEAQITVESSSGERVIEATDFFEFHFMTSLEPTEMVTAISVPRLAPTTGFAFLEVSRRHGDFAVAGVAALVRDGRARLAFAGVTPKPLVVETSDPDPAHDAVAAADEVGLADDLAGSSRYRRRLIAVLARRATERARARARGAGEGS
ncbi:MAG: aerobic carbon-monoxide dehydrogenase medium subunit [Thermoleophilaceae bacterium]|nr:aerobic carbon-monoxide dehydrogenase medium subunit [Thermoleophilaceae bacterium]MEA2406710.1 aerobic carbon-monoxide dehydrogenase medium subunit [Thermoleophilaceae bacterium]